VPARFHVSLSEERAEYDKHENEPEDPGYRKFLSRLAFPLIERLPAGAQGLDFGSGPGPCLSLMMEEAGHPAVLYDPFYADEPAALEGRYDFISATEVVEHLREPGLELERLVSLLNPGGILAIMTKLVASQVAFASWHYINDKTHIAFFSQETFEWLSRRWSLELERIDKDVVFLTKSAEAGP
jgi:hypothetical protein